MPLDLTSAYVKKLSRFSPKFSRLLCSVCLASCVVAPAANPLPLSAQDLLNDNIQYAGVTLKVKRFATLPSNQPNIISMTTRPDDSQLYVSTQEGKIFSVQRGANNTGTPVEWFNVDGAVRSATGQGVFAPQNGHGGLRGVAFHPDFASNGKFYVSMMQSAVPASSSRNFLGTKQSFGNPDSVLVEFTYDHQLGRVDASSMRELFRIRLPVFDHPIKEIGFNKYAKPGDEDYGLLYIAHGDASDQPATAGGGQVLGNALGKILRINPLQNGSAPYSTTGNPFVGQSGTLPEIYATGFRNPHTFSFAQDRQGDARLIVGNIGRDNMEEVELVTAGANHGWSVREGTFVHKPSGGYITGVSQLPANEADLGFTYPAAQFDHDASPGAGFVGIAIATGHVIANGSDPALQDQLIFGEFGNTGKLYHASFGEMLNAVTKLDPTDLTRDEPSELTQAAIHLARIAFDHDNNPNTADRTYDSFTQFLGQRPDFRFGEGKYGELYISTKRGGVVYIVTNSVPEPRLLALFLLGGVALLNVRSRRQSAA